MKKRTCKDCKHEAVESDWDSINMWLALAVGCFLGAVALALLVVLEVVSNGS